MFACFCILADEHLVQNLPSVVVHMLDLVGQSEQGDRSHRQQHCTPTPITFLAKSGTHIARIWLPKIEWVCRPRTELACTFALALGLLLSALVANVPIYMHVSAHRKLFPSLWEGQSGFGFECHLRCCGTALAILKQSCLPAQANGRYY